MRNSNKYWEGPYSARWWKWKSDLESTGGSG